MFPDLETQRRSILASVGVGMAFYIAMRLFGIATGYESPYLDWGIDGIKVFPLLTAFALQIILLRRWSLIGTLLGAAGLFGLLMFWPAFGMLDNAPLPFDEDLYFLLFNLIGLCGLAVISAWFDRASAIVVLLIWVAGGMSGLSLSDLVAALSALPDIPNPTLQWIYLLAVSAGPYLGRLLPRF